MDIKIPGLSDALGKLDITSQQMESLNTGIGEIATLLKEQNDLIRSLKAGA